MSALRKRFIKERHCKTTCVPTCTVMDTFTRVVADWFSYQILFDGCSEPHWQQWYASLASGTTDTKTNGCWHYFWKDTATLSAHMDNCTKKQKMQIQTLAWSHTHAPTDTNQDRHPTHTQLASTSIDRAPKRETHKAALFCLLLLSFPWLPVCVHHPWHGKREWEDEKTMRRSVKNKQDLHLVCLALQISEMNSSQRRMWRESLCKKLPKVNLAFSQPSVPLMKKQKWTVNKLPAELRIPNQCVFEGLPVICVYASRSSHIALPEGACYPLHKITTISLRYCPTYPELATMCVLVCHVLSLQMSKGLFVHNLLCVCTCVRLWYECKTLIA